MHETIIDFINYFLEHCGSKQKFNNVLVNNVWTSDVIDSYADEMFYYKEEVVEVEVDSDYVYVRLLRNNYSVDCDGDYIDTDIMEEDKFKKGEAIDA
jgi:hypothetical protein